MAPSQSEHRQTDRAAEANRSSASASTENHAIAADKVQYTIALIIAGAVDVILGHKFLLSQIRKMAERSAKIQMLDMRNRIGILRSHSVRISPEGLQSSGERTGRVYKWNSVERIVTTNQQVYIHVCEPEKGVMLIPNSAFESDSAREHFIATIHSYRKSAPRPQEA
jgi:hypothetical protein